MLPEEEARIKIDKQLRDAGWEVVSRFEYNRNNPSAIVEASMQSKKESDYLLFVDNKAIAVVEAKRGDNNLEAEVAAQAETYSVIPQHWYGFWLSENRIPLVYLANGKKILFKNMLLPDSDYVQLDKMHTPKEMLQLIGQQSEFGVLPLIEKRGLRDCQYRAEVKLEESYKAGKKRALAVLATGSGKTYLACLASYRFLEYTPTKRILFLADRNNLTKQAESEFKLFDRTETGQPLGDLYDIARLKSATDIKGDIIVSTIQKLYAVLTGMTITDTDEDAEDEIEQANNEKSSKEIISLGDDLKLPPNYFQFIIVDECHRSIYGRWQAVLNYFTGARILGLTATPTEEALAFFDKNIVENYTYEDSVVDGVNVPKRIFRINTEISTHGGTIEEGAQVEEKSKRATTTETYVAEERIDYSP
ncbi:MAG: DEAD/DEAH box helicase family protein, partial [Bacilli bacterium]|nr:DEAD/DEAH box helicase family protein [Bacilli bacterium]